MFVKALCLTFGFFTEFCILNVIIYVILEKLASSQDSATILKLSESTARVFTLMSITLYFILILANKG